MSPVKKKNILEELRRVSNWEFTSKCWAPVVANREGINLTVRHMTPIIRHSRRIRRVIKEINERKGIPIIELHSRVLTDLQEMGHHRRFSLIRWLGVVLCHTLKKNYSGIMVNEDSITRVKSVMGSNPVIFAPSHKSYADFILMSFLCFYYDIEIPVIAAGQDFQNMWVMGRVLRECGAFFIRRTFGDDHLYKVLIAEYVDIVLQLGKSALEFFVEGTRSRSGKSLPPRYGFMSIALEPYFLGKVPDITIVPVSISYERTLEESLFTRELLGAPKPRESTRLLFKAMQMMNENYGRIFVDFGEPISIKEFSLTDVDPRILLSQEPTGVNEQNYPGIQVQECIKNLCYHIINEQNRLLTITPYNLLAASMSVWTVFKNNVPLSMVESDVKCFQDVLHTIQCSTEMKGSVRDEILNSLMSHEKVVYFDSKDETLKLNLGFSSTVTMSAPEESSKGVSEQKIPHQKLSDAYPIVFIQQYANPVCLQCINISLLTFVVRTTPYWKKKDRLDSKESVMVEYSFFRTLFASEFALQDDFVGCSRDFEIAVKQMKALSLYFAPYESSFRMEMDNDSLRNVPLESLLMGLLLPFVQGYKLCLDTMYMMSTKVKVYPAQRMKYMLQFAMSQEVERSDISKYVLCLDLIGNAIMGFQNLGIIQKEYNGKVTMYRFLEENIRSLRDELAWRLGCVQLNLYRRLNVTESSYWRKYKRCRL